MMKSARTILLVLAVLAVLAPSVRATDFAHVAAPDNAAQEIQLEKETFALINDYRRTHNLGTLVWNSTIAETARLHSRQMAEGLIDFGHVGFRDRVGQLSQVFTGLRGAGENVLFTDDPHQVAESAVTLWLHSPEHLHNIRGDYNYSGIGVWVNPQGVIYFTQIFVKSAGASASTVAGG